MAGFPWYLLAFGIFLLLSGLVFGVLSSSMRSRDHLIDPRLSDEEIAKKLRGAERGAFWNWVIVAGAGCMLISVVWRIALIWL
jgi:hypothetical protein